MTKGRAGGATSLKVMAASTARVAASASFLLAACTCIKVSPARTWLPSGKHDDKPTRGSTVSPGVCRPPPSATTAMPIALASARYKKPSRGAMTFCCTGAAGRFASCKTLAGPPSPATMRAKRSAAAPLFRLAIKRVLALWVSAHRPASTSTSAPSARVTCCSRWCCSAAPGLSLT